MRDLTAFYPTLTGVPRLLPPTRNRDGALISEQRFGRVAQSGVFRTMDPVEGRPRRLVVQTRTGVALRAVSSQRQVVSSHPGRVALAAAFDPPGPHLAWVQTGHFRAATTEHFDGSTSAPPDLPQRDASHRFRDGAESWWVDSRSPHSARYSAAGISTRTLGYRGGRVIYDLPSSAFIYDIWMAAHPDVRRVRLSTDFRAYLYVFRGGGRSLAAEDPLVSVDWWCSETVERTEPGGEPRETLPDTGVRWIVANPTEPVALDAVVRGDFRYP